MATTSSLIEFEGVKFLIMDAPDSSALPSYLKMMKDNGVSNLVRTCELTYTERHIEESGIKIHVLKFVDGSEPPNDVINKWLQVVRCVFSIKKGQVMSQNQTLGVHCLAGLGRSPLLVCIALIEFGMTPMEAVKYVRKGLPNALTKDQVSFICKYRPKGKLARQGCEKCTIF